MNNAVFGKIQFSLYEDLIYFFCSDICARQSISSLYGTITHFNLGVFSVKCCHCGKILGSTEGPFLVPEGRYIRYKKNINLFDSKKLRTAVQDGWVILEERIS